MKMIKKTLSKKIRSRRGESMVESLISIAVSAIAIAMLAEMIMVSVRITDNSKKSMDEYYSFNNDMVNRGYSASDEKGFLKIMKITENGTVSNDVGFGIASKIEVAYVRNPESTAIPLIAYYAVK